jgi:hypothetical protein
MRVLAVVLASSLIASGCAVNSYKIPPDELARLARVPPEARGEHVRVVQELVASEVPAAPPVTGETQVVIAPQFDLAVGVHGPRAGFGGGLGRAVNGKFGGLGKDSKSAAVAFLFAAATAAVTAAVIEGSRFDGWAKLHPMHPVHLIGHDGSYTVVPLAWLDPSAVAWTDTAVVRPAEGPWRELERAPLSRQGLAYGLFGGTGSLRSADGSLAMGPAWTVQLGYFATQQIGVFASAFFGWRDNQLGATLFETRYRQRVHPGADRRRDVPARHQHPGRADRAPGPRAGPRRADARRDHRGQRVLTGAADRPGGLLTSGTGPSTRRTACRRSPRGPPDR